VNRREKWRSRLAGSYWVWRLYHLLAADAVAIQRPTKFESVREFLGDNPGVVLDLGCGPGVFTRYLCERATQVWAADIDEASLRRVKARHRGTENLGFVVAGAERLPFADGCLNTILFLEVLEHLPDDAAALLELRRVLRADGKLVLSVPVPPGEVDEDKPWGHKREGYEWKEIASLLERNSFRVTAHRFAEFRFSRLAARLIRGWRKNLHVPAPIFLAWVAYLDRLLDGATRQEGGYLPGCVVILAENPSGCSPGALP
jgi:SAM-dependent methyltransferase